MALGILFISHSSADNAAAVRVRAYLGHHGWNQVFLDVDPEHGIAPGHRWQQELKLAGERCSGVLLLVSPDWIASRWCQTEFLVADQLGKQIFPVLISPVAIEELPFELRGRFQIADASTAEKEEDGFQHLVIGLRRAGLDPTSFSWPPRSEPTRAVYRGLKALEEEDAAIFFGRDALITKALDSLRRMRHGAPERLLVFLGASGAGKSSFLRAGVVARLRRDEENFVTLPVVRPERAAFSGRLGLAASLGCCAEQTSSVSDVLNVLSKIRSAAMQRLQRYEASSLDAIARKPPTIVIAIDQAEEFFVSENREAEFALSLLSGVLRSDPDVLVVLTIRSDSFERLQQEPSFADIPLLPFSLPPLPLPAFKEVIEGPARLSSPALAVEPALSDRLLEDLAADDALPLLAFTLERLLALHPAGGRLLLSEYLEEFGGLQGAITAAVDAAFSAAKRDPRLPQSHVELERLARAAFIPGLVYLDAQGAEPKRRVEPTDALPESTKPLVRHFIDQRLLVCHRNVVRGRETDAVEVTHEAILRRWPALRTWIGEERGALHALELARKAAFDWQAQSTTRTDADRSWLIHRGSRLEEAEALMRRPDFAPTVEPAVFRYLSLCRQQEDAERSRERESLRRTWRLQRNIWILVFLAAGILLLAGVSLARFSAGLTRQAADTLAAAAASEGDALNYDRAARFAVAGLTGAGWGFISEPNIAAKAELAGAGAESSALEVLRGHSHQVLGAAFSPDGTEVVTASRDKSAVVWNVKSGRVVAILRGHTGAVRSAAFSADGKRIVTASEDKSVRVWDSVRATQLKVFRGYAQALSAAAFSPDSSRIVVASDDGIARILDSRTGRIVAILKGKEDFLSSAVFSSDGRLIVIASGDGTASVWEAQTGQELLVLRGHTGPVNSAKFSSDDKQIVTASDDQTARIWDATTGRQISLLAGHAGGVRDASFDTLGRYVVTASADRSVRIWNVRDAREIAALYGHDDAVNSAAFSPNGGRIISTSDDKTARLWSAALNNRVTVLRGHDDSVNAAAFSPDGKRVITGSSDRTVRIWDTETGQEIAKLHGHGGFVEAVAFSPDGRYGVSASDDKTARIWDGATGREIRVLRGHTDALYGVDFSPDGKQILTSSKDRTARLWDTATGREIGTLSGQKGAINSATFSEDGKRVVTASADGTSVIWDLETHRRLVVLRGHRGGVYAAQFSHDGKTIVTGGEDSTARLWDAETGHQKLTFRGHTDAVTSVAMDRDSKVVVTSSRDKTIRVWDAYTGENLATLRGHAAGIGRASESSNGKWAVSASDDHTARIWSLASLQPTSVETLIQRTCSRNLSHGLSIFSPGELRSIHASLDSVSYGDACRAPGGWNRLSHLFFATLFR